MVFDLGSPDTFSALKAWETFISEVQPSVLVCVGNKSDIAGDQVSDEQRDAWLSWCWDLGLEMVECSALHDEVSSCRRHLTYACIYPPQRYAQQ